MAMTFSYLNNQMICYTKADAAIASMEDLAGKSVGVQNGSYAEEILNSDEFAAAYLWRRRAGLCDRADGFAAGRTGRGDHGLGGRRFSKLLRAWSATDLKAAFALADDNYGIGFRKEDIALRDKVQEVLVGMKKDGSLGKISEVWFGTDITVVPAQ